MDVKLRTDRNQTDLKTGGSFVLSYNGGTSRGETLARYLAKDENLLRFYQPLISHRTRNLIAPQNIVEDPITRRAASIYNFLKKTFRAKPTKRYAIDRFTDRRVASRLIKGGRIFLSQAGISLSSMKKARQQGAILVLDRTNTHIIHQNKVWRQVLETHGFPWKPSSFRVTQIHLEEYRQADAILVLSKFVRDTFISNGVPAKKIFICPSGIDSERFTPGVDSSSSKIVLFCGSISLKKGSHFMVDLAQKLQVIGAEVWLVGSVSPEMTGILESRPSNCRILPFVSHDSLPDLYRKARCFVLPSLEEGLPKVVLEAMACGLPVVTTPEAAAEELLDDGSTGYVVRSSDPEELFSKTKFLLENPQVAQAMGTAARRKVEKSFTERHYYQRFRAVVETIISNSKT